MLVLCDEGALEGGLSVALDVQPDEAVGALCAAMGGSAARLRVLDVRADPFALLIRHENLEESWDVPDVPALVHNLNDLFRLDPRAKAVAVLGEWKDALQLLCVSKSLLPELLASGLFRPRNEDDLRALLKEPE